MNGPLANDPLASKPVNINDVQPVDQDVADKAAAIAVIGEIANAYNKNDVEKALELTQDLVNGVVQLALLTFCPDAHL